MNPRSRKEQIKGALEIVEEAFHLLRRAPASIIACYYAGVLPFVAGLLYFWTDMSLGPAPSTHFAVFGEKRILAESFGLALLFIWMKTWQVVFARGVRRQCSIGTGFAPTGRSAIVSVLRTAGRQAIIQPSGLLLLPLAMLATVPFGYVYAFYQNATVLDDDSEDLRGLFRRATAMSAPWQRQNHLLIWALSPVLLIAVAAVFICAIPILSAMSPEWVQSFYWVFGGFFLLAMIPLTPFGLILGANIAAFLIMLPSLAKMLFGIQSLFTDNLEMLFNDSFLALVCALTYCCMDPLLKTAYVLRGFYLDSRFSGEDLRAELRRLTNDEIVQTKSGAGRTAALLLFAACALSASAAVAADDKQDAAATPPASQQANVAPPSAPAESLDKAIESTLQSPEYAWRLPKKVEPNGIVAGFMKSVANTIAEWVRYFGHKIKRLLDWIGDHMGGGGGAVSSGLGFAKVTLYTLGILLACIAVCAAVIAYLYRRKSAPAIVQAQLASLRPDLEDDTVTPDALPENGWLDLAQQLLEEGNPRLALRAVFLAGILALSQRGLLAIARYKTNRDYKEELRRRAHTIPNLQTVFSESTDIYESIWYGTHEATLDLVTRMRQHQEQLRTLG